MDSSQRKDTSGIMASAKNFTTSSGSVPDDRSTRNNCFCGRIGTNNVQDDTSANTQSRGQAYSLIIWEQSHKGYEHERFAAGYPTLQRNVAAEILEMTKELNQTVGSRASQTKL